MTAAERRDEPIKGHTVLVPTPPGGRVHSS